MIVDAILTERAYQQWPSYHVVYEWEDVFASILGCPIKAIGNASRKAKKACFRIGLLSDIQYSASETGHYKLVWVLNASSYDCLPTKGVIPIFVDFPMSSMQRVLEATRKLPIFFVTCLDIARMLKEAGCLNVEYMALSIADKYCSDDIPKKTIDVIQFGRKNDVLHGFMLKYCEAHPDTDYVFQTEDGSLTYTSTVRGDIGKFETRQKYLNLIGSGRVTLVSTPCCDGGRSADFGNIDFVTPRFYESAALYCRMIGRYTDNRETQMLRLAEVCPNVKTYDQFEALISDRLLSAVGDWTAEREFVKRNKTSERANCVKQLLSKK